MSASKTSRKLTRNGRSSGQDHALFGRKAAGIAALSVAGIAVGLSIWLFDVPQKVGFAIAQGVSGLGFEVKSVKVRGLNNAPRLAVYSAVLDDRTNSMLAVDLEQMRQHLMSIAWIEDATIQRKLPDTLIVTLRERTPAAIWQYKSKLAVIDQTGKVLDTQHIGRFARLPVIVGNGAQIHVGQLFAMLKVQPELAGQVDAATWVGERRWNLRFRSGETLMLPEGREKMEQALQRFAAMDKDYGFLGRGFARFDMRLDGRMMTLRATAQSTDAPSSNSSSEPNTPHDSANKPGQGLEI